MKCIKCKSVLSKDLFCTNCNSLFYTYANDDFEKAFKFAVEYYLDPKKSPSGRTTAEPRGLGSVIDAFLIGKLAEIAVPKMLSFFNLKKSYELDFSIKSTSSVRNDPDIISIVENDLKRNPNNFIEIKRTSNGDRWIGLTDEQLSTMRSNSQDRQILIVFVSISSVDPKSSRSSDLLGMFLKHKSGLPILDGFDDINAHADLEFIISVDDLEQFGTRFPKDSYFYETELFQGPIKIRRNDGDLIKGIKLERSCLSFSNDISVPLIDGSLDKIYGTFYVKGNFNIYKKINSKSQRNFIECLSDTVIQNDIFGSFELEKGKTYRFNLFRVGSDPKLKRNNLFIAKRRIYQLISLGNLSSPEIILEKIANSI